MTLDVRTLTAALWGMKWDPDAERMAAKIAAEYRRMTPPPIPSQEEPPVTDVTPPTTDTEPARPNEMEAAAHGYEIVVREPTDG